ncbi:MAG: hypothetical protein QJR03_11465 [Sphaerobacter sp.]|nr:hypothetical protein [Sphaerobacter sp.]
MFHPPRFERRANGDTDDPERVHAEVEDPGDGTEQVIEQSLAPN